MKTATALTRLTRAGAKVEEQGSRAIRRYKATLTGPTGDTAYILFKDFFGEVCDFKVGWGETTLFSGYSSFTEAFDFLQGVISGE